MNIPEMQRILCVEVFMSMFWQYLVTIMRIDSKAHALSKGMMALIHKHDAWYTKIESPHVMGKHCWRMSSAVSPHPAGSRAFVRLVNAVSREVSDTWLKEVEPSRALKCGWW